MVEIPTTEHDGNEAIYDVEVEKIEDVESAPAPKESEGATEVARKERVETSKRSDYGVMIELLDLLVVNDRKPYSDAELSDMVEEGRKDIENRYGEDALTPDRVKGLLEILGAIPGMLDEKSSAALSKNPEVRKEITHGLCEPFLRGHLEPGEILYLVQKIEVKPISETTSESKSITGYEGVFHYKNGTVIISEESLNGSSGTRPDFRHLFNHEMAHGVTETTIFNQVSSEQFNNEINSTEAPAFSSKMIAETRRILDSASTLENAQPQHISTVLKSLKTIDTDYEALSADAKAKEGFKTLDEYRNFRRYMAAKEIITDYFAVFQQSDGTLNDFVRFVISKCYQPAFAQFARDTFGIEAPDSKMARAETQKKIEEINTQIESKELTAEQVAERYPKFKELSDSYEIFFNEIKAFFENRGDITVDSEDDEWMYDNVGFYDGGGGFMPQGQGRGSLEQKADSGIIQESKALLSTFADEFGGSMT